MISKALPLLLVLMLTLVALSLLGAPSDLSGQRRLDPAPAMTNLDKTGTSPCPCKATTGAGCSV